MQTKDRKKVLKKKPIKQETAKEATPLLEITDKIIEDEEKGIDFDPRRQKFANLYYSMSSTTFGNAFRSAIQSGFSPEYAKHILATKPQWLEEIVRKMGYLDQLENNFDYHIKLDPMVQATGPFGPLFKTIGKGKKKKKVPIMVRSNTALKLRQEMTMYGLDRLHPDFKKKEKGELDPVKVEIKQIIIIAPNGERIPYNKTGAEAISSIPKTA